VKDLNDVLPALHDDVPDIAFDIPGLEDLLGVLDAMGGSYTFPIPSPVTVSTGEQEVECIFSYNLPREVETIRSIKLGSDDDKNGILVNVRVSNPKPLENSYKELDFRIDFPQNFKLAKNGAAEQADKYSVVDGHSIVLDGFVPEGEFSFFSFYLTDITDIDEYIDANGVLNIDQAIKYKIDYTVSGNIELTSGLEMADFAFGVSLDVKLAFLDLEGKTRDINVDFDPVAMDLKGEFDNLQYIDSINYIVFAEGANRICFTTSMDKEWLDVLK
jgi:hypothetical protein